MKQTKSKPAIDEVLECNSRAPWFQLGKGDGNVLTMKRNDEANQARLEGFEFFSRKDSKCKMEFFESERILCISGGS